MVVDLTAGAIPLLSSEEWKTKDLKPVLQLTDVRLLQTQTSTGAENKERFKFVLSDGSSYQHGMLGTHLNGMVRSQQLQKGSIVQLIDFVCNSIRGQDIIIILNLTVLTNKCDIIGDPKPFLVQHHGDPNSNIPMGEIFNQKDQTHTNHSSSSYQGNDAPSPSMMDLYKSMERTFELVKSIDERVKSLETSVTRIDSDVHHLRMRVHPKLDQD